ncbi:MAG: chemotaxis protein CheD [Nitrospirae bacterium]|nr:chemotaxis protein CheD [Nitrospirota bacterium]MBI3351161.1 chemotaxis protein CheD [Nitrospirota bacterium]
MNSKSTLIPLLPVGLPSKGRDAAQSPGGISTVYLHAGQLFAASTPSVVTTVLGSCVAVGLWNPFLKVGGVNHYLLPFRTGKNETSARFGDVAIHSLIEKVLNLGGMKTDLRAKIFGGACVVKEMKGNSENLGLKNVEVARRLLQEEGIPVMIEDVGGAQGRKLVFHVNEGVAWVKLLGGRKPAPVKEGE